MRKNISNFTSAEKVIELLMVFCDGQPLWGISELSIKCGFSPPTVQRIINFLKKYGFVDQDFNTKKYSIGKVFYRFFKQLQIINPLSKAAQPYLSELLSQTRESVTLNIIAQEERMCIDVLESPRSIKVGVAIGTKTPLYAGSSGKCLLAFSSKDFREEYLRKIKLKKYTKNSITNMQKLRKELLKIQQQKYSTSLQERNVGFGSLSAPILNFENKLLGCINMILPETKFSDEKHIKFCLEKLIQTSMNLSRHFGYTDEAEFN